MSEIILPVSPERARLQNKNPQIGVEAGLRLAKNSLLIPGAQFLCDYALNMPESFDPPPVINYLAHNGENTEHPTHWSPYRTGATRMGHLLVVRNLRDLLPPPAEQVDAVNQWSVALFNPNENDPYLNVLTDAPGFDKANPNRHVVERQVLAVVTDRVLPGFEIAAQNGHKRQYLVVGKKGEEPLELPTFNFDNPGRSLDIYERSRYDMQIMKHAEFANRIRELDVIDLTNGYLKPAGSDTVLSLGGPWDILNRVHGKNMDDENDQRPSQWQLVEAQEASHWAGVKELDASHRDPKHLGAVAVQ